MFLVVASSVLLFGGKALADVYDGVPDENGFYAHCNLNLSGSTTVAGTSQYLSCQFGVVTDPSTGKYTTISAYSITTGAITCTGCFSGNPGVQSLTQAGDTVLTNYRGQYKTTDLDANHGTATLTGGGTVTACTVTLAPSSVGESAVACTATITFSDSQPVYPEDYYPGGVSGSIVQDCFTISPSDASAEVDEIFQFDARCTVRPTGATVAWTYTVTVGSCTKGNIDTTGWQGTVSCNAAGTIKVRLRVTYNSVNYDLTKYVLIVASNTGDSADCPTGWALLNPASYVSLAICLFEPTDAISGDWTTLSDTATDHYPAGPVIWVGTFVSDGLKGLRVGVNEGGGDTADCDYGGTWDVNGGAAGGLVTIPVIPGSGSDADCADNLEAYDAISDVSHPASGVLFYALGALAVYRLVTRGSGGGGEGDAS